MRMQTYIGYVLGPIVVSACTAAVTAPSGNTPNPAESASSSSGNPGGSALDGSVTPSDGGVRGTQDAAEDAKGDARPAAPDAAPPASDAGPADPSPFAVVVAPQTSSSMLIRSIWGSDANNMYFCGDDYPYDGALWRWNGTSLVSLPSPRGRCNHVSGAGPNNVWVRWDNVAGEPAVIHRRFDGAQWTYSSSVWNGVIPIDATESLGFAAVYNGSRTVGGVGFSESISGQVVLSQASFPATCWSSASPPAPSVVGDAFGAADVWVKAGDRCVMHWDGAAWTKVQPSNLGMLGEVHGAASNDVWAVGDGTCPIAHWNGSAWSPMCVGLPAAEKSVYAVYGAPDGKAWAVGSKGVYAFNGASWTNVLVPTSIGTTLLRSVWGSSSSDVWLGGDKGVILHTR